MKFVVAALALIGIAVAAPLSNDLSRRQFEQLDANDVKNGTCKPITFIWARGTFEPGNMGVFAGAPFADALKKVYPNQVAVQGVDYEAGIMTNFEPNGADPVGVTDMKNKINEAVRKCPDSKIVAGGYNQGAAVTHAALPDLSPDVAKHIAAVVMFGDTQKAQSKGQISGIPTRNILIVCVDGDDVCNGNLNVGLPHLSYLSTVDQAASFVKARIGELPTSLSAPAPVPAPTPASTLGPEPIPTLAPASPGMGGLGDLVGMGDLQTGSVGGINGTVSVDESVV